MPRAPMRFRQMRANCSVRFGVGHGEDPGTSCSPNLIAALTVDGDAPREDVDISRNTPSAPWRRLAVLLLHTVFAPSTIGSMMRPTSRTCESVAHHGVRLC